MSSLLLPIIYISFVSLGLPDSLLGSAWPVIYPALNVPVSWSGIIFIIISSGTVLSSLQSDRLSKTLGTGKITALSTALTAFAMLGFSLSRSFITLCLLAVPYGLGAGSIDAALNNYVALHFKSRHMSWLHCMWGVGASVGPYIMSAAIAGNLSWTGGYRIVGIIQAVLSAILLITLPIWKTENQENTKMTTGILTASSNKSPDSESNNTDFTDIHTRTDTHSRSNSNPSVDSIELKPIPLKDVLHFRGAKEVCISFFCYCAIEQTISLWAGTYLVLNRGIPTVTASAFASLFFIGITVGRAVNGFLTFKLSDTKLIHLGEIIIAGGLLLLILPLSKELALAGFVAAGLGCAPIYPCIIHSTPAHFGADKSQAMVGVQMAAAYVGNIVMPPLFGLLSDFAGIATLPVYLFIILAIQFLTYNRLLRATGSSKYDN